MHERYGMGQRSPDDLSDYKSCLPSAAPAFGDQVIAVGDSVTRAFQLSKAYRSGGKVYHRPVTKSVLGSVRAGIGGAEVFVGINYAVDYVTGRIVVDEAPAARADISAGFEFDVPVRFDTDRIAVSVASL